MAVQSDDRASRIHDLELTRQRRLHQTELIKRDEDARRLKLRAIILKDDNATLKEHLTQKDSYQRQWIKQRDQLRTELNEAREMIRSHEARSRKQTLEVTTLKAEVDSLTTSMQDSGKALQEKFALTRELNRLRPEMEHLQSQLTNYQAVISEKHDLRRQVDSLEVELENERRARQRTKAKTDDTELHELRSQLQDSEKKFTAARKEKERMKKEHEAAMASATAKYEQSEEDRSAESAKLKQAQTDLKQLRAQVKAVQQELEDCRTELESAQIQGAQSPVQTSIEHTVSVPTKAEAPAKATGAKKKQTAAAAPPAKPARKRRVEESLLDEASIGTPGNESMGRPSKKRGLEQAAGAEKSAFSITPFLNRNKGLSDVTLEDTPVVQKAAAEPTDEAPTAAARAQSKPPIKKASAPKAPAARARGKATALSEAPASKKNAGSGLAKSQESSADDATNGVGAEEVTEDQENAPSPKKKKAVPSSKSQPETKSADKSEPEAKAPEGEKKRKRKLLGAGTTLFDEDEGEVLSRPVNLAGPAARRPKIALGGTTNGFGAFSPLKRHKRGVNASYLA